MIDNGKTVTPGVPWQGLNHLALITNDMDTTVRFWHGVIGAPLVIDGASFRPAGGNLFSVLKKICDEVHRSERRAGL